MLFSNEQLLAIARKDRGIADSGPHAKHLPNIRPEQVMNPGVLFGLLQSLEEGSLGIGGATKRMQERVHKFKADHPLCGGCGEPLDTMLDRVVMVRGTRWHLSCFNV